MPSNSKIRTVQYGGSGISEAQYVEERLYSLLSGGNILRGVNEHNLQDLLFERPEIYFHIDENIGLPLTIRKEVSAPLLSNYGGRPRADILVQFYGDNELDIIECKGPRQPIIGRSGKITRHFEDAINQANKFRKQIMEGLNRPRMVIVGYCNADFSAESQKSILIEGLAKSRWLSEFKAKRLTVTTWQILP
jgi:hypothetical protein